MHKMVVHNEQTLHRFAFSSSTEHEEQQQQQQKPPPTSEKKNNGGMMKMPNFLNCGDIDATTACDQLPQHAVLEACGGGGGGSSTFDDDTDSSVVESVAGRPPQQQQQQQARQQPSFPPPRVRNLVEGIMSPFISCVQPPLQACVAPVTHWEPRSAPYPPMMPGGGASIISTASGSTSRTTSSCLSPNSNRIQSSSRSGTKVASNSATQQKHRQRGGTYHQHHVPPAVEPHQQQAVLRMANQQCPKPMTRQTPIRNDILCGRGNATNRHAGNQQFRDLVAANKETYTTLTKKGKMLLARQIVDLVHDHTEPPGMFLARDASTGLWYDIGLPRSLEKASQALREKSAAARAAEKQQQANSNSHNPTDGGGQQPEKALSDVSGGSDVLSSCGGDDNTTTTDHNSTNVKSPKSSTKNHHAAVQIPEHLKHVFGHNRHAPPLPQAPPANYLQGPPAPLPPPQAGRAENHPGSSYAVPPPPYGPPPLQPQLHPLHPSNITPRRLLPAFRPTPPTPQQQHRPATLLTPYLVNKNMKNPVTAATPPRNDVYARAPQPYPNAAIVTPQQQQQQRQANHRFGNHPTPRTREPSSTPCAQPSNADFPQDVFQNPEYICFRKPATAASSATTTATHGNGGKISPTQEKERKRQRTSTEASHKIQNSSNKPTDIAANPLNISGSSHTSSTGLTNAIESQLTLEERVITSPSSMLQSVEAGRTTSGVQSRGSLPKTTDSLDNSADGMDGLVALSTAAFLRLDESY